MLFMCCCGFHEVAPEPLTAYKHQHLVWLLLLLLLWLIVSVDLDALVLGSGCCFLLLSGLVMVVVVGLMLFG